jgi:DNA-binding SARP family transcriptional activator
MGHGTEPGSAVELARSLGPRPSISGARLSLLGSFRLFVEGAPLVLPTGSQRLLARLAICGRQARVHLAGTLWPEIDEERALGRLRTSLWRLHRQSPDLVVASGGHLALGPHVEVDAHELVVAGRSCVEPGIVSMDLASAKGFLAQLDVAELLPGWYDDWVLLERDRLSRLTLRGLEALVDIFIDAGRAADALEAAHLAVRADPLRESSHRAVIRVHLAAGNPGSAVRQFETYRQLLRTELGIDQPTDELVSVIDGILAGRGTQT